MRTKTLLLTAAIVAAGAAASMAQNVYSLNVVGYVNVSVKQGFNMISNPLDDGAGNYIDNLIPTTADGTVVFTYANPGGYSLANYTDGVGWDDSTTLTAPPGHGFWFQAGSATNITFVGTVVQGTTTNLTPAGFNLIASVAPVAKQLGYVGDGSTNTWEFQAGDGDVVFTYANPGGYSLDNYTDGVGWDSGLGATIAVGQGFWIQKAAPGSWIQTFTVQ